ncbi:MAG: toxin [Nitrospirae bacterium]|nr:MAG: toxin [Nitrospirota bacterium]
MKYDWDSKKNECLKKERNISFETIIFHLARGDVWKLADHPDQENYPGQKIYFVVVDDYVYLVPHVVEKDYVFLKTIIPSRKATKAYKNEKEV